MSAAALRYDLRRDGRAPVFVEVPGGTTQRVRLPDSDAKARLVGAVLATRCGAGEVLELFGETVNGLKRAERARLHDRIGVLTQAMGLISNLNAWENISLQAAYHGTHPVARIAKTAREALAALGADPQRFLARLPDEMNPFERKLVAFVRLLAKEPALAVIDGLGEGLSREQSALAARFEAEYRARQPEGTLLFVDLAEEAIQ
jgi:predicted ABC-type transport system involved in lysophospholipase L1 biosynthesis ATPase subunit